MYENLHFYGMREGVLGEYVVRVGVRAYVAKEMRFCGMIPGQRLKGRLRRIMLTLVRTNDDCVR